MIVYNDDNDDTDDLDPNDPDEWADWFNRAVDAAVDDERGK